MNYLIFQSICVYFQGVRVLKDFDIKKEAGNLSFRAVEKKFTAHVSQNFLEVHLLWAGKGTCCIPLQGTYGPSIAAISATPGKNNMVWILLCFWKNCKSHLVDHGCFYTDFTPTVSNKPPSTKKNHTGLIVGIVVGFAVLCILCVLVAIYIAQRRKRAQMNEGNISWSIVYWFCIPTLNLKLWLWSVSQENYFIIGISAHRTPIYWLLIALQSS